jgi:hypothetical protein
VNGNGSPGGLIFGLIRLRSSVFSSVRISAAVQVAEAGGAWRNSTAGSLVLVVQEDGLGVFSGEDIGEQGWQVGWEESGGLWRG